MYPANANAWHDELQLAIRPEYLLRPRDEEVLWSKAWGFTQHSLLRSLSELLILKALVRRYPDLQRHQVSCHAAHEMDGRIYPCGNCEKCRRICGMLCALGTQPQNCGYSDEQVERALNQLATTGLKQLGTDLSHLYWLLTTQHVITNTPHTAHVARSNDEVMCLRFDKERSTLEEIPTTIRKPLLEILMQEADGAKRMVDRKWTDYPELMTDAEMDVNR